MFKRSFLFLEIFLALSSGFVGSYADPHAPLYSDLSTALGLSLNCF
nr:MAG TPA: hypothetical protein [Bacteriophage sp.]